MNTLNNDVKTLKSANIPLDDYTNLETELATVQDQIKRMNSKVDHITSSDDPDVDKYLTEIQTLKTDVETNQKAIQRLPLTTKVLISNFQQDYLDPMTENIKTLQTKLNNLSKLIDIDTIKTGLQSLKGELSSMQTTTDKITNSLKRVKKDLKKEVHKLETALDDQRSKINSLQSEQSDLHKDVLALKSGAAAQELETTSVKSRADQAFNKGTQAVSLSNRAWKGVQANIDDISANTHNYETLNSITQGHAHNQAGIINSIQQKILGIQNQVEHVMKGEILDTSNLKKELLQDQENYQKLYDLFGKIQKGSSDPMNTTKYGQLTNNSTLQLGHSYSITINYKFDANLTFHKVYVFEDYNGWTGTKTMNNPWDTGGGESEGDSTPIEIMSVQKRSGRYVLNYDTTKVVSAYYLDYNCCIKS